MKKSSLAVGAATVAAAAGALLFTKRTTRKVEALVPRDGRLVDVAGQRVHVAEVGNGPSVLLIHGLGGQMRNFGPELVADLARDYRVIRVDRPGSGYSPREAGVAADLPTQAKLIAALIDQLGLDRPWIVGHSLGGALALTTAVLFPGKVGGLLLIAPASQPVASGEVSKAFKGLMVPPRLRSAIAHSIAVPMSILGAKTVLAQVWKTGESVATVVEREGLQQVNDTGALEAIVAQIIQENPKQAAELKAGFETGQTKLLGFFVGQIMKRSGGKANPTLLQEIIRKKL